MKKMKKLEKKSIVCSKNGKKKRKIEIEKPWMKGRKIREETKG
jgi:hypothetical protein